MKASMAADECERLQVAERYWDRVRWAIEEYAWRFDGYSRAPREGGTI